MKKILSFFSLILISFHLYSINDITLLQDQDESITIAIEMNDFNLDQSILINGVSHSKINAKNTFPSLIQGYPDLPKMVSSIQLPNQGVSSYNVVNSSFQDFYNVNLVPSKGNLKRNIDPNLVPYSKADVYNLNAFFPNNLAILNSPFVFRSVRGQSVEITPFQYNPITKTLRVYSYLEIEINFDNKVVGVNEIEESNVLNAEINRMNQRRFINYKLNKYDPVSEDGSLLIICKDDLVSEMETFVNWKVKKGIPTEIVPISSVGNSQTSIFNYVQDYYNNHPEMVYLLLVGDHADINCYNAGNAGSEIKWSDAKYGLLAGSNDWYPDVFVGRFSVSNSTDLNVYLARNMEYEITPLSGDWYQKAIGLGSDEGQGFGYLGNADWAHLRAIRAVLMDFTFDEVHEFYDGSHGGADANGDPTSTMVKTAVNAGATLFNYTGHGAQNVCVTGNFSTTHINQATNDGKYPFVISVACNNGTFTSGSCISEAWMLAEGTNSTTGSIAACGSSILMSWAPPMATQFEIAHILAETYASNKKFTLGGLFYNGQMKMMDVYNNQGKEVIETWVFFGDPSVKIRTLDPQNLTASHDLQIELGSSSLSISSCNAEGALITLTQNNGIIGTGIVDGNGDVQIDFTSIDTLSDITVVGTNYNYRPYQGVVKVTELMSSGPVSPVLSIYPNPVAANGSITFSFELNEDSDLVVKVVNALGQVVKEMEYNSLLAGSNQQSFSTVGLRAGIYELYTVIDGKDAVAKFLVK